MVQLDQPDVDPRRRARGRRSCAYLAAVYLFFDARRLDDAEMVEYFRRRAVVAAIVAGVVAFVGIFVLHDDAALRLRRPHVACAPARDHLRAVRHRIARAAARANAHRGARLLAIGAVATVVIGWGVAQWAYILPETLTVSQAAAPDATLATILVVFIVAAIVILPVARIAVHARPEEPARARPGVNRRAASTTAPARRRAGRGPCGPRSSAWRWNSLRSNASPPACRARRRARRARPARRPCS